LYAERDDEIAQASPRPRPVCRRGTGAV